MNANKPSNTMALIAIILGGLALLFSFIPYIGILAIVPGVVCLILGVLSLMRMRDDGYPQGMSIAAIVISVLTCVVAIISFLSLKQMISDIELKEYTSCEEMKVDYDLLIKEMQTLTREMEDDPDFFEALTEMFKIGPELENIEKFSEKLGCNFIEESDFDFEKKEVQEGTVEKGQGFEEENDS